MPARASVSRSKPRKKKSRKQLTEERTQKMIALVQIFNHTAIGFVKEGTVRAVYGGVAHNTVWRWVKDGKIPAPYKLPSGQNVWDIESLRKHMASIKEGAA